MVFHLKSQYVRIAWHGPFVASDKKELQKAFRAYQDGGGGSFDAVCFVEEMFQLQFIRSLMVLRW